MFRNSEKFPPSVRLASILENLPLGPRQFTLAEKHLQYIASWLLKNFYDIKFKDQNNHNGIIRQVDQAHVISIEGVEFSLTAILASKPDFEHLHFTTEQLHDFSGIAKDILNNSLMPRSSLHRGEAIAIQCWTDNNFYKEVQGFLQDDYTRTSSTNERRIVALLVACIATQGLKHLTGSSPTACRGGDVHAHLTRRNASGVTINPGFWGAQAGMELSENFNQSPVVTRIYEKESTNSIGKLINDYSLCGDVEREVLFPPNTDFIFQAIDATNRHWNAVPVRTIAREENYKYEHGFDDARLNEIAFKATILRWDAAVSLLKIEIIKIKNQLRLFSKTISAAHIADIEAILINLTKENISLKVINAFINKCQNLSNIISHNTWRDFLARLLTVLHDLTLYFEEDGKVELKLENQRQKEDGVIKINDDKIYQDSLDLLSVCEELLTVVLTPSRGTLQSPILFANNVKDRSLLELRLTTQALQLELTGKITGGSITEIDNQMMKFRLFRSLATAIYYSHYSTLGVNRLFKYAPSEVANSLITFLDNHQLLTDFKQILPVDPAKNTLLSDRAVWPKIIESYAVSAKKSDSSSLSDESELFRTDNVSKDSYTQKILKQ